MILISHRGNVDGKQFDKENRPDYISNAITLGYDVEIDIWYIDDQLWLGHDEPQFKISIEWLSSNSSSLWIHCKDMNSLSFFNGYSETKSKEFNYFSHDVDMGVLTSHNYIWSINLYERGILVLPEIFNTSPIKGTIGICSDVIQNYKKK